MLKNSKAKGKQLERYVAKALNEFDKVAYARLDSGSGLHRKEDVFTTLPFFIECKNQAEPSIKAWWDQTISGCPKEKYPVLIYRLNYQKEPTVVIQLFDLIGYIGDTKLSPSPERVSLSFADFLSLIRKKYDKQN